MKLVNGIKLHKRRGLPIAPEKPHTTLHFTQHEASFFAHSIRCDLPPSNCPVGVISRKTFCCFTAASYDKRRPRVRGFDCKTEGVEARHGWRRYFGANITSRHWVYIAIHNLPCLKSRDVFFVESKEATVRKRGGRS